MIAASRIAVLLPSTERLAEMGVRLAVTIIVALLVLRLLFIVVTRIEKVIVRAGGGTHHAEQRAKTLGSIMRSMSTAFTGLGALIYGLEVLGLDIGPLIAGAGVLGVAIGFGAQTIIRDFLAGLFILAEDQFAVGEVIEVNGRPATVESITVRTTTLRDQDGYLYFVPNGEMRIITNRSRGWNRAIADVIVHPDGDVDGAIEACRQVADQFSFDPEWRGRLLEPVRVWGVEGLAVNEVRIRVTARTRPGADAADVGRELRRRLLHALSRARVGGEVRDPAATSQRTMAEPPM